MKVHEIKTHTAYFQANREGEKPFELRFNDRNYRVGDYLYSREYDPECNDYTGRWCFLRIGYVLSGEPWLQPGYVAMTVRPIYNQEEYERLIALTFYGNTHQRAQAGRKAAQ